MKTLKEYILESQAVTFGGKSGDYNQCVILAGGPGSGKGFIKGLKVLTTYKTLDVDDLKKQYIELQKRGKIKDTYQYDLKNPEDVSKLHTIVKSRGWKKKQREAFWNSKKSSDKYKQNILFDMVSDNPDDIYEIIQYAKPLGYTVTFIWVCCNIDTAREGNLTRDRTVYDHVIKGGHDGAYKTVMDILSNKYDYISENIDNLWIAFSAGYKRMLTGEYAKSPVIKIDKDSEGKFNFTQKQLIDDFLKKQMPEDPDWESKQEAEKKRQEKLKNSHVNTSKFKRVKESLDILFESLTKYLQ